MADVIDLLSSDEDEMKEADVPDENVLTALNLEPANKKPRLAEPKADIIVLIDDDAETENLTNVGNDVNKILPEKLDLDKSIVIDEEVLSSTQYEKEVGTDLENGVEAVEETDPLADTKVPPDLEDGPSNNNSTVSTDIVLEFSDFVEEFVQKCIESVMVDDLRKRLEGKVSVLKKAYSRASSYIATKEFKDLIETKMKQLKEKPRAAIAYFNHVFVALQDNYDVSWASNRHKKLYVLLEKLKNRIAVLEKKEVDFDDEEDSTFMQLDRLSTAQGPYSLHFVTMVKLAMYYFTSDLDETLSKYSSQHAKYGKNNNNCRSEASRFMPIYRYRTKAVQVYKKMSEIQKSDVNSGRAYYGRLDFAHSSYPEINRALNKKYQNREKNPFPSLDGVDKCIRKCVKEHNLDFSDNALKREVKSCFEQLGNLLQKKRKVDLANVHLDYLNNLTDDPAKEDPELNRKLNENRKLYQNKLKSVLDKFEQMQEDGIALPLSEDSDDSNQPDSENDNVN